MFVQGVNYKNDRKMVFGRDISELLGRKNPSAGQKDSGTGITGGNTGGNNGTSAVGRGIGTGTGTGTGSPNSLGNKRLKAIYKKPQTDESKKPFIARTSAGSSRTPGGSKKGMAAVTEPDYKTGDRVRHIRYGEGTVTALEKTPRDYKVTVIFDDCGQKIMYAGFAKLQKL